MPPIQFSGINSGVSDEDVATNLLAASEAQDENPDASPQSTLGPATDMGSPEEPRHMDDEAFRASVKSSIDDAVDYIDGFVAPLRAKAMEYYRGDLFGNEEEGRSQIVMTEVRDTVLAILPSLLRIFTSSEEAVEYQPNTEDKVEMAEQATDYANLVFYGDNPGFLVLHSAFKDALTTKLGIVKWRWSEDREISEAEFTGLDEMQITVLSQEKGVEVIDVQPEEAGAPVIDMQTQQPIPQPPTFTVRIRRTVEKDRCVVEAIAPEEFLIARDARDVETANYCGHRSLKTMSELIAMGYPAEDIEQYANQGDVFIMNYEAQTRNPAIMSFMMHVDNPDPSMRRVIYTESFVRIDYDGDGIAELRKVCSIGNAHHVLHNEVATEIPFATFCPDPTPHMIVGSSTADQTMDLQLLKSNVVRNTLDSLAQVIHPRTVVVEGQVNMDDVMNNETGAIIRARQPGMVQPLAEPFVGQAAMPIIAWLDEVRAQRTGVSPASQGLDPDVLQSTTKAAVTATVTGAQERTEMIARIFAETGMKRLFKGILRTIVRHQDKPRMVKLRGKWVQVDPKYWDSDLDVKINVALGQGTSADRMQFLMLVAQKQEQIIQLLGPINPLCDVSQYRNTLTQICSLAGFKDASRYFKPVDIQAIQQQMASQPPKPDPNMMLVEIEAKKVETTAANNAAETQRKTLADQQTTELGRYKMQLDKELAAEKARLDKELAAEKAHFQLELERVKMGEETSRHSESMRHDRMMKRAEGGNIDPMDAMVDTGPDAGQQIVGALASLAEASNRSADANAQAILQMGQSVGNAVQSVAQAMLAETEMTLPNSGKTVRARKVPPNPRPIQ